jgi:hypothetical protein
MKNELSTDIMQSEISVIEQNHHNEILSIHGNMQQLIDSCNSIEVSEDDKEGYEKAVELKRVVKATHVAIEKKRKELKQPLIDYGKRLDRWVEEIYNPLVQAEKLVKKKMESYEARLEVLKQEKKIQEEESQQEEAKLDIRLKNLNAQLEKINLAKSKAELKQIEIYLDSIAISDFGKKSNEAGFILNQLKMTCSMASRLMQDEESVPVQSPKIESTPITDDFLNELKEMPIEPVKKVVIKDVVQDQQEVSIKNDEVIFEENELVISENVFFETPNEIFETPTPRQLEKASDDDVIEVLDFISSDVIKKVISLIDENTEMTLKESERYINLDFSEHKELILIEVKKRIGVLLKEL